MKASEARQITRTAKNGASMAIDTAIKRIKSEARRGLYSTIVQLPHLSRNNKKFIDYFEALDYVVNDEINCVGCVEISWLEEETETDKKQGNG